jgi:hypothetical protein
MLERVVIEEEQVLICEDRANSGATMSQRSPWGHASLKLVRIDNRDSCPTNTSDT